MIREMIDFIRENELSPFNKSKTSIRTGASVFKTVDARAVYNRVLTKISQNFVFSETANLFHFFDFKNWEEISRRQEFFKSIIFSDNGFLSSLKVPKKTWKPRYDIVVVTEDEDTFLSLKDFQCPVQFINSPEDVSSLSNCDVIQVLGCENSGQFLEQLSQTVFLNSCEEVYLERYLEKLSGWKENILVLEQNPSNEEINKIVSRLKPFMAFISDNNRVVSREDIERVLDEINEKILNEVKSMTLSGDSLIGILSKNKLPDQIVKMIRQEIISKKLPEELFNFNIPLSLDENQLSKFLKEQSASQFTNSAESIRQNGKELKEIPSMLQDLSDLILIFDFLSGISKFARGSYPAADDNFVMRNSANLFLDNPQPVDFELSSPFRCSILTGANSGGKTTLLEHIIQNIALFNIGLPVRGELKTPVFSEVYYFAKNKGSMSKGAFETLLTQMAGIKPGKKTLILADEMEAVTEPGVAADIVCATAKYFISKECFLVIATHLGKEIQKNLPLGARIDGIEAKGLDENNELIVDHNPVLGRLANSTPELIVERLAKKNKEAYFQFLFEEISS